MFDEIYLTGFKKFQGHDVNPTEEIVLHFLKREIPGLKCTTLQVANKEVEAYLSSIEKNLVESKDKKILNFHFGVGPNKVYFFEMFGYNNMDYRIPDNYGFQPIRQKIGEERELDFVVGTALNVMELKTAIPQQHPITISLDPGRYLCNFIYFKSLIIPRANPFSTSLFIHFPVHSVRSHEQNIQFVESLLKALLKGYKKHV